MLYFLAIDSYMHVGILPFSLIDSSKYLVYAVCDSCNQCTRTCSHLLHAMKLIL